jgi:predicted DNA-binding WGR domain protein
MKTIYSEDEDLAKEGKGLKEDEFDAKMKISDKEMSEADVSSDEEDIDEALIEKAL